MKVEEGDKINITAVVIKLPHADVPDLTAVTPSGATIRVKTEDIVGKEK